MQMSAQVPSAWNEYLLKCPDTLPSPPMSVLRSPQSVPSTLPAMARPQRFPVLPMSIQMSDLRLPAVSQAANLGRGLVFYHFSSGLV